jgi:hypothetical protein
MALFGKSDISKSKYIIALVADINAGKAIKVKGGKSYTFKKTKDIIALEKVQTDVKKYEKIIYPNNIHEAVFTDGKQSFRFIDIDKAPYSGMGGSRNALGKKLADAGELATVMSLTKTIKTPKDTGQKLFEDNPDAFQDWLPTFQYTKPAVEKIVGSLSSFDILHDATDKSKFSKAITAFCKKVKIAKDSWNPADIFIIKSSKKDAIAKELQNIVDHYEVKDGLVDMFNNKIYMLYLEKLLYPISLKQLISDKPKIELSNEPGKIKIADYNITINNINCNLSAEGKEIGLFTFMNNDTTKQISLQVRGFPHGYGTAQTEITSDGSPTGGRLGKISTKIVDRIMDEYNDERISSISYFGKSPNVFSTFNDNRINEVYGWYKDVIKHPKVKDQNPITKKEFKELIEEAKSDYSVAENLCMKIQGLKMMHFFVKNDNQLSQIMNKMINGAKKISSDNGFFVKIY